MLDLGVYRWAGQSFTGSPVKSIRVIVRDAVEAEVDRNVKKYVAKSLEEIERREQ